MLRDMVEPLGVPAIADAPIGHVDRQWTLPLGILAALDADGPALELLEPPVT